MKRMYFVRHGLSDGNIAGIWTGRMETPLSNEGREQARLAGQAAKALGIDLIVSSTQERAFETAKIIAKEIGYASKKILVNSLFVERDFGDLEGKKWHGEPYTLDLSKINGVETDEMLIKRAEEAYAYLQTLPADNILVASHGSFGRALRKVLKTEHDFHERIPNAEIACWLGPT